MFRPQSMYRGRDEIQAGICPVSWSEHYNFARDGITMKVGRRAAFTPPPSPARADFSMHDGMYARKWPLPLCVSSVVSTFSGHNLLAVLTICTTNISS